MKHGSRDRHGALERIERELARIGLLLQHDRELPSFTTLFAGAPIDGSWWGHPLGHDIYHLLGEFEEGAGALSAKLIDGKVTFVHSRLWPAFLTLALHGESVRARRLAPVAESLHALVLREGTARADELVASGFATSRELMAAGRELERHVLVHTASIHTAAGAHTKVFRTWARWAADREIADVVCSPVEAAAEFTRALELLRHGVARKPKVPLLDGAR